MYHVYRTGPRHRPIRPLPRALIREGPKFGGKFFLIIYLFFIYKYFWEILKHFSLHFFFHYLEGLKN